LLEDAAGGNINMTTIAPCIKVPATESFTILGRILGLKIGPNRPKFSTRVTQLRTSRESRESFRMIVAGWYSH
jgi:hypothetical protein